MIYLDTPGLADANMRQAAASSITDALKQNGKYQVFFVITLSAGRLRAEDLTTISLVLSNVPAIKVFNIIINKLSKEQHKKLQQKNKKTDLFANLFTGRKYMVLLLLYDFRLEDADDTIFYYSELDEFARDSTWLVLDSYNVNDIPGDNKYFENQLDIVTNKINFADNNSTTKVRLAKFIQLLLICIKLFILLTEL